MSGFVLAVRPEPGLAATMAAGKAIGLNMIGYPLFEVRPLAWKCPDPTEFDALLIGSANAIRHGGATRVDVSLSATDACLSLVVADNGTWLWPTDSASTGLTGLRERAVQWRGSLVVDHGDETTRIEFRVPLGAMGVPHTRR